MNTADEILSTLIDAQAPVQTRILMQRFGEISKALDLLVKRQQIIRVRGVGATVELA